MCCLPSFATVSALVTQPGLASEAEFLNDLSPEERIAMNWVREETPPSSQFLISPTSGWPTAKTDEWFLL
jgi:hypothetical protein